MFEYLESVATDIVDELNNCAAQMEQDALDYENRAKENEGKADANISKAESLESAEYTKTETYEDTDTEGNVYTETRVVEDTERKAAAMQEAANLRAEAVKLRIDAGILRGLAAVLRTAEADVLSKSKFFSTAIEMANKAVDNTTAVLEQGANTVSFVLSILNVPDAKNFGEWVLGAGNNLLKIAGIDLSDGLNDEIYAAIGMATEWGKVAGANVIRMGVSYVCSQLGDKWYDNLLKQGLNLASETLINTVFTDTGAKLAQNAIASFLTSHGINALPTSKNQANLFADRSGTAGTTVTMSFDEARTEAKRLYADYVEKLDNYSAEEKAELIRKFNEEVDKAEVLSDSEFTERFAPNDPGVVAVYNGSQDRAYIREGFEGDPGRIIHEVGGHGTGTMCETEGYYYVNSESGELELYTGNYADSPYPLQWCGGGLGTGINESTTEYFTRRISGENREDCRYNSTTDALEIIVDSMTKNCGVNGEELLFDSYTGDDKEEFGRKYNEVMRDDNAYEKLDNNMFLANKYQDQDAQWDVLWDAVKFAVRSSTGI